MQRQHGKTSAQVNHVVVFSPSVRNGDRYSRKGSDIIAGLITFIKYKGQFSNTVPSVCLFKVPNDESPAVYVDTYGKKQAPFVCKQTRGLPALGVYLPRDYFGGNNKLHKLFYFYV